LGRKKIHERKEIRCSGILKKGSVRGLDGMIIFQLQSLKSNLSMVGAAGTNVGQNGKPILSLYAARGSLQEGLT